MADSDGSDHGGDADGIIALKFISVVIVNMRVLIVVIQRLHTLSWAECLLPPICGLNRPTCKATGDAAPNIIWGGQTAACTWPLTMNHDDPPVDMLAMYCWPAGAWQQNATNAAVNPTGLCSGVCR